MTLKPKISKNMFRPIIVVALFVWAPVQNVANSNMTHVQGVLCEIVVEQKLSISE